MLGYGTSRTEQSRKDKGRKKLLEIATLDFAVLKMGHEQFLKSGIALQQRLKLWYNKRKTKEEEAVCH